MGYRSVSSQASFTSIEIWTANSNSRIHKGLIWVVGAGHFLLNKQNNENLTSLQVIGIISANYLQIKPSIPIFSTRSKAITGKLCFPIHRLQYLKQLCVAPISKVQSWHITRQEILSWHIHHITLYRRDTVTLDMPVEARHITEQRVGRWERAVLQTGVNRRCGFTRCFRQMPSPKSLWITCRQQCQLTGKLETVFP